MKDTSASNLHDTTEVRAGQGLNEARLGRWLEANVRGFQGPFTIRQFRGGQSNPTYLLSTPERAYVLRRKPAGQLLKGAHAIEREARVISVLKQAEFPVPHVHALCLDDNIIGTSFYVMERVEGRIFWDASLSEVERAQRPEYYAAMNDVMAELHNFDYVAAGLSDFGRPGNYFARQISRWSSQYLEDAVVGRDPNMDRVIAWLRQNIPASEETSIVHGDLRIDNMIFHPTEPRILAVIDWELSTLGDPLSDFAYNAMAYHMPPHIIAGLAGLDLVAANLPTEREYIDAYCRRTGRSEIENWPFYKAFSFFRLAAIFHGIQGRVVRGNAASAEAADRARWFPELAAIAWSQAQS